MSVTFNLVDGHLDGVQGKKVIDKCTQKLEKLSEYLLGKRQPTNLVNTIFYLIC